MLNTIGFDDLPTLRCHMTGGTDDWQLMPTRARLDSPRSRASAMASGVGRVRVAAARAASTSSLLVATPGMAFQSPFVALEERGEGAVDVAVVEQPDEHGRHEAAVLAHLVHHVVAGAGQQDVLVDARTARRARGRGRTGARWPRAPTPGTGGRHGCTRCSPSRRGCSRRPELVLEVERLVADRSCVVADDVVRADDHAPGAAGAQAAVDDLLVELFPLGRPPLAVRCRALPR